MAKVKYCVRLAVCILFLAPALCCCFVSNVSTQNESESIKPPLYVATLGMWSKDIWRMLYVTDALKKNFTLIQDDENYDLVITTIFDTRGVKIPRNVVKLMWVGEPMKAPIEGMDVVIGSEFIDSDKYIRISIGLSENARIGFVHKSLKKKKKFCAFLYSIDRTKIKGGDNLYTLRKDFFRILSNYKRVDSGGRVLNNIGYRVPYNETMDWLSNYKFVIAFENREFDGYVTEKLFNAYYAGAIPIWAGARSALKGINKKAIIYAGDFASIQELADYVAKVDQDPALYDEIWNQPLVISEESSYEHLTRKLEKKILNALENKRIIKIDDGVIKLTERAQHEILKRRTALSESTT